MENMTQKTSQMLDEIKVVTDEIKIAADEINVAAEMGLAATEQDILAIHGHSLHIGHSLHLIGGDDSKQRFQWILGCFAREIERLGRMPWECIPVETVKRYPEKDDVDLESGVKAEELVCECCWKNECPKYAGYANDIERIVKELKDEGYGLEEYVKGLKGDGCALKFIRLEAAKVSKDDDFALKFIPVEMVKELKEDGYALFIPVEMAKLLKDEDYVKMGSGGMIEEVVNKSWGKRFAECFGYANDYIEKTVKPEMGLLFSGATMQNIYQLVTSGMVTTGKGKTLMKLNEAAFMMLLYGLVMPRRAAGHVALAVGIALASAAYLVTMSFAF